MSRKISREQLLNLAVQHEAVNLSAKQPPILALDYGEKFCGLAVAPDGITVLPAAVVSTDKLDSAIDSLISNYHIKVLVIGLPVSADGSENHICKTIRKLATVFENFFSMITVALVNERHSTQRVMSPDNSRIDDLAAMQILEYYLSQTKK